MTFDGAAPASRRRHGLLVAALAGAACDAPARAQGAATPPPPADVTRAVPIAVPAGWAALAAPSEAGQAAAAQAAAGRGAVVRTWGDSGLGCFATVVEVSGARVEPLARVASELELTVGTLVTVEGWTFVDGPVAEVGGRVARRGMRGTVRGLLIADPTGVPHAAVAACFYNEREPVRCQTACTELLASLEAPRVTP